MTEDFAPSPHEFLVSNKSLGYKLTEALADLVDNSISANANKIYVEIKDTEDSQFSVVIADNGHGMGLGELRQSFRPSINSTKMDRSKNDLGRFGMGMKTAACWFSKTIFSPSSSRACAITLLNSLELLSIEIRLW